jgi:hypothetical protein
MPRQGPIHVYAERKQTLDEDRLTVADLEALVTDARKHGLGPDARVTFWHWYDDKGWQVEFTIKGEVRRDGRREDGTAESVPGAGIR